MQEKNFPWTLEEAGDYLIESVTQWRKMHRNGILKNSGPTSKENWVADFAYWLGQRTGAECSKHKEKG